MEDIYSSSTSEETYSPQTCDGEIKTGKNKGKRCSNKAKFINQEGELFCKKHSTEGSSLLPKIDKRKKEKEPRKVFALHRKKIKNFTTFFLDELELSPMDLGPVEAGFVCSFNLHNYFEGNKLYKNQTYEEFQTRRSFLFSSKEPCKQKRSEILGIVFDVDDSMTYLCDPLEARKRYCHLYFSLTSKTETWKELMRFLDEDKNINLYCKDSSNVKELDQEDLTSRFFDMTTEFKFDLILMCMLTLDETQYPWVI